MLTAVAWSLQFVQLPILRPDQLAAHRRLNSRLIALPMAIELATAAWIALRDPRTVPIAALALWGPIGYATLRYSRLHPKSDLAGLKRWNLVRAVCWTARCALVWLLIFKG